jgi:Holliday junction resolvase
MKEQDIQRKFIQYLESQGAYVVKVISASKSGVPDILFCYEGVFAAIEVKTPTTKNSVSRLQQYNIDKIHECGGQATVAWTLDQVEDFLRGLLL